MIDYHPSGQESDAQPRQKALRNASGILKQSLIDYKLGAAIDPEENVTVFDNTGTIIAYVRTSVNECFVDGDCGEGIETWTLVVEYDQEGAITGREFRHGNESLNRKEFAFHLKNKPGELPATKLTV